MTIAELAEVLAQEPLPGVETAFDVTGLHFRGPRGGMMITWQFLDDQPASSLTDRLKKFQSRLSGRPERSRNAH